MGRGLTKKRNNMKKQFLKPLREYCERLEKENEALKGDPNTLIGQFVGQYREIYAQNGRLSTLAVALLQRLGDKVTVSKEEIDAHAGKRINIKWDMPEGVTDEKEAKEFIFSYHIEEPPAAPAVEPVPEAAAPTNDDAASAEASS